MSRDLFAKVDAFGDCWLWTGAKDGKGYGHLQVEPNRWRQAHLVVYEELVGLVPPGQDLDHLCRIHACVNPDHLEPVRPSINIARAPKPRIDRRLIAHRGTDHYLGRRTHCKNGHPFTGDNLLIVRDRRRCRRCSVVFQQAYRQRRQAA
jgi:hypothetical protein